MPETGRPSATWRQMREDDLGFMLEAQKRVYPDYQEDRSVFLERLALFPAGCHVLQAGGVPCGYAISHPWLKNSPPKLDSLLGVLPAEPGTYYLHDIALLPEARGSGGGGAIIALLTEVARGAGQRTMSLTAVQGSETYWQRHGFVVQPAPPELATYGDAFFMVRDIG